MRYLFFTFLVCVVSITSVFAQTRQSAIDEFNNLKERGEVLEKEILSLSTEDINSASSQGLDVFRLLPREIYDKSTFKVRGGGSFYSFTNKSHNYNDTPQINLAHDNLLVGFAGANYGFIVDLEKTPMNSIEQTEEFKALSAYKPPKLEAKIRAENNLTFEYGKDGEYFYKTISVNVGNTYLLRSVSFGKADIIVAFKIHRQDTDGSLIIFWKQIKEFKTPVMLRQTDEELKSKIANALIKEGFNDVTFEVKDNVVTLRGFVPKGKMGEAVMIVNELKPRKVENQLIQQK